MSQSIQIENRGLVVTGASSGPGEAAARRLAADGARVVLGARRIERLEALAVAADVMRGEDVQRLVDTGRS
ncbi:SDR family NAD(P)-dependent oxidoreductase [Burkholderia gladioli]|uniref:SDR family NAD(P)-dependent oxidoreductase n=1 Tax=Burkholderia gladioli TaxID=28095 RepID=UPI000AA23056